MDFVKLRELQQSGEIKKSTLQTLTQAEKDSFKAYIIKESFKQEHNNFESICKANKKKIRTGTTFEIPLGEFHHHDPHENFKEDYWNFSEFVEILGSNPKIYARIENHETVITDINYKLEIDQKPDEDWDHEKPQDVRIEECKNEQRWIRMLVYYRYSAATNSLDSFLSYAIGKINLAPLYKNYIHALFPGQDGSVFWFGGNDKDELNIHKPGDAKHEQHKIDKKSLLHQFLTEGNSYSESGRTVPVQLPQMKVFEGNQVIIFSRFVYGELPSVCFYSVELQREIIQLCGSSMLLYASLTEDPYTKTHMCLLYANPFFCSTVFPDSKAIMNEQEGDLWNEKIDKRLTPPIKRQDLNIATALAFEKRIDLNVQEDFKPLKDKIKDKTTLEEIEEIIEAEQSKWIPAAELQFETIDQGQWMNTGEIFIQQFEGSDKKQFFALSCRGIASVCEFIAPNKVNVLYTKDKQAGQHAIVHDAKNQKFRVFGYFHNNKKWSVANVSEDSAQVQTKKPEEQKFHHGHDQRGLVGLEKGVQPLSFMIQERLRKPDKQLKVNPEDPYWDCFKLITENLSCVEWKVQHFYPFHTIMNRHQPNLLYIFWRANRKKYSASFDVAQLGKIYSVPEEIGKSQGLLASITALIEGFEPDNKLTRLELRVLDFCWNAMTINDIKFSALMRKYQKSTVRADRFGRLLLQGMITQGEESGFYISALATIQAIDDEQTPADPVYEQERGNQLSFECSYIACDPPVFFVSDHNTKTSYMSLFSKPNSKYTFNSQKIKAQRCPENEQKESFVDIDPVILVLDDKAQFYKLRVSKKDVGQVQKLMSLDLSETHARHCLDKNSYMSKTAMMHSAFWWCSMDADIRQNANREIIINDDKRDIHENIEVEGWTSRVPHSDQVMVGIKRHSKPKKLKIAFINDPCSRSQNPLGYRRCYGLPNVDRVINIFSDLYLVQSKKMSDISRDGKEFRKHKSYWLMMKGDLIYNLHEPLEKALLEQQWTMIKSCKTIYGNCKISLHKFETDGENQILLQKTCEIKIIECSQKGELIEERKVIVEDHKLYLQEEIFMTFDDYELLVQVSNEKSEDETPILQGSTPSSIQRLTIYSQEKQQFAMVGKMIFWNSCSEGTIHMYELISNNFKSFSLSQLTGQERCDQLILSTCSPFQLIRQSHNNTLDEKTMLWQSNHLQVTTKNYFYIFDCNTSDPALVKSMRNDAELSDCEKYVESSYSLFQNEETSDVWTNCRPNQQGSMIEERIIPLKPATKDGQSADTSPVISVEDSKLIGLYKTFSTIDIYIITHILKRDHIRKIGIDVRFHMHTMWALFGTQTAPDIFNKELTLVMSLKDHFEEFEIPEKATKKQFSSSEVRLASIMTQLTHVVESKESDPARLSSFFRNSLNTTSLRDVLTKIGWQSRKFSICNVLTDQQDSQKMLKASTSSSTEELNKCYIETSWTRRITSFELPEDLSSLVIQRKDIIINREDIKNQLEKDQEETKELVLRQVSLKMIDMPWFFANRNNFVAFAQHLQDRPNKVYSSLLVETLLAQYWKVTQLEMIYYQFLPFLIFAIMSITHFIYMLVDHIETEDSTSDKVKRNVFLSIPIFCLWCFLVKNEIKQVKNSKGFEYLYSKWNWIDITYLSLTVLVIIASFEPFTFIEIQTLRALASIAGCLLVLKILDWLRLFEQTAEYVLLMEETIMDTRVFMILIFVAMSMFGIPLIILNENRGKENAINETPIDLWFFDMLIGQLMLALGDWGSTRRNFQEGPQATMIYIFFILGTFISLVTMLNMLIAIMGDTFDKMMENKDINAVKSKLQLVADLGPILKQKDIEYEPKTFFFILETLKDEEDDDEKDEWQGTIKTMTRVFKQNDQALKKAIIDESAKMQVYLNDLRISDEVQDIACRDQIELSVKQNAAVQREHIEKMQKHIDEMFAELLATVAEQKRKKLNIDETVVDEDEEAVAQIPNKRVARDRKF